MPMLRELGGTSGGRGRPIYVVEPPDAPPAARIWGLSLEERLRRSLTRAQPHSADAGRAWLFRSDYVLDERLIRGLETHSDVVLVDPTTRPATAVAAHVPTELADAVAAWLRGEAPARELALRTASPADIAARADPALRKAGPPVLARVSPANARAVEAALFDAAYKGATDLVTKWVWPLPARAVTGWLARRRVSPNWVTGASWLLAAIATLAFASASWVAGLFAAWTMTFLDTVDGKLARVTLRTTRSGHVLDHGLDLLHPPFWYAGWAWGLGAGIGWLPAATAVVVGGYCVGRLLEGAFLLAFGIETHSWRRLDSHFRTVTARRNPNLLLLSGGTAMGHPEFGFAAVAVWTAISLAFHAVRLLQAGWCRFRGEPIRPWFEGEPV